MSEKKSSLSLSHAQALLLVLFAHLIPGFTSLILVQDIIVCSFFVVYPPSIGLIV